MMGINNDNHIANQLLQLTDVKDVTIGIYFVKRDGSKDDFYFSKSIEVESKLSTFLKEHIISELNNLRVDDGDKKFFRVSQYNNEFQLMDVIGIYDITQEESEERGETIESTENKVIQRVELLRRSIVQDALEKIHGSNFQIVTLEYNKKKLSFCFYRSIKKIAKNKKWAILSSDEYKEVENNIIELGGPISFFFDNESIYIIRVKDFENAFEYKDHISIKSEENLNKIAGMGFFMNENSRHNFIKQSKNQLFSRGLAQISDETMKDLNEYYDERVKELKQIQVKLNSIEKEEEKRDFEYTIGDIIHLLKFINFETGKIIFPENENPKPLLHFFQDKIVSSFLTKKIRTVMGY